jgi:probable rRNA maturation factor
MVKIRIENRQKKQKIKKLSLRKVAQRILSALEFPEGELSVVIVDDKEIRFFNRQYLHRDRPTNVISFAMQEGEGEGIQPAVLGDVMISADTAARDAAEADLPFESELYFLLLHGILHLLGYDHEGGKMAEARRMEAKEEEIFTLIQKEFLAT